MRLNRSYSGYGPWRLIATVLLFGNVERFTVAAPANIDDWQLTRVRTPELVLFTAKCNRLLLKGRGAAPELWDTRIAKRLAVLSEHDSSPISAAWSPSGQRLLTVQEDAIDGRKRADRGRNVTLRIWATESAALQKTIRVNTVEAGLRGVSDTSTVWIDDSTILLQLLSRPSPATVSTSTTLALVNADRGVLVALSESLHIGDRLSCSPNHGLLLATCDYGITKHPSGEISRGGIGTTYEAHLVSLRTLRVIATMRPETRGNSQSPASIVQSLWSPDSRYVVTAHDDHSIQIWDGSTGGHRKSCVGHTNWIVSLALSSDGQLLTSASEDCTAKVWNIDSGVEKASLTGHTAGLYRAVFDKSSSLVATAAEDGTARVWDWRTRKQVRAWAEHESNVVSVEFIGDRCVRTVTATGVVRSYSLKDGTRVSQDCGVAPGYCQYGNCYVRDNLGSIEIWTGPTDGSRPPFATQCAPAKLGHCQLCISMKGGVKPTTELKGHNRLVNGLGYLKDRDRLVSAGGGSCAIRWDLTKWNRITGEGRTMIAHPATILAMSLSPGGEWMAAGYEDGRIGICSLESTRVDRFVTGQRPAVRTLAFSPDGSLLAWGCVDGSITVSTFGSLERVVMQKQVGRLSAIAFSEDGMFLASAGEEPVEGSDNDQKAFVGQIVIWEVKLGKIATTMTGHSENVNAIAFSPDGKVVASASNDKTVRLWSRQSGKPIARLKGGGYWFTTVAFSRDGKRVIAGDWSGSIWVWDSSKLVQLAHWKAHESWINCLTLSPNGASIATGATEIRVWAMPRTGK